MKFKSGSSNNKMTKNNTIMEKNDEETVISNVCDIENLNNNDSKQLVNNENDSINNSKRLNRKEKFRHLMKKNLVYDSFDDEEYKEEEIDYYISPDSWYIKIFDILLLFSSLIYFIMIPYFLSKNYLVKKESKTWKIIFVLIDIIYIIDIVINFFRAYTNFDEHLVRKTKTIFFNYIKSWFLLDLIQAIPFYSLIKFFEKSFNNNSLFQFMIVGHFAINPKIYMILLIKIIKLYKLWNKNSTLSYFAEIISKNELLDDNKNFIITFFLAVCFLNMTTCLFIFIGINSYPGWIVELKMQDQSYLHLYLTSIYFVIVTITTVGYGDITGKTVSELLFQMYLLIIGTIAYSFIISYISNNIIKMNQKSMSFEKNLEILQEIKLHHPNMKNSLYNEVLRNLYNEQLYERKDKHLLFDCLPYSLKNKLIMEMFRPLIKNFVFFKDIDNSDFIVKVATSLKPLISIKGDIVIQEGDYIKEILFIKKGIIALNICINVEDPESSLKQFVFDKKMGKLDISFKKANTTLKRKTFMNQDINTYLRCNQHLETMNTEKNDNFDIIKIIELRNNEHFGDALMFLNERSPLMAKVRSKTAELLILRKIEAIEIYSIYPNIWKRINKKSLYNMEQIYLKIKKVVIEISSRYNISIYLNNNKKKTRNSVTKPSTKTIDEEHHEKNKTDGEEENHHHHKHKKEKDGKKEEKKENRLEDEDEDDDLNKQNLSQKELNKIEELNETLSVNYGINIMGNTSSLNMVDNVTFFKKATTQKESLSMLSQGSAKNNNEKNLLFKKTRFTNCDEELNKSKQSIRSKHGLKNNVTIKSKNTIKKKNTGTYKSKNTIKSKKSCKSKKTYRELKNTIISNCYIKFNTFKTKITRDKGSFIETQKNTGKHSSVYPIGYFKNTLNNINIIDSNKTNSNALSSRFNNDYQNTYSKNEKLIYNVFTNLTTTQEKSFQLNSSYDNINKISNNKYIKDINLQSKVRQVLIGQCLDPPPLPFKKKRSFLMVPTNMQPACKSRKNSLIKNNINETLSEEELEKCRSTNNDNDNILKSMTLKSKRGEAFLSLKKPRKQQLLSSNKLIEITRNNKLKNNNIKSPILDSKKVRKKTTKKKPEKINKQLNLISKNIEITSKNINNPEEFYMDFFTNIIANKTKSDKGDEQADNKVDSLLNPNSGEMNDSINTIKKNSNYLNLFDSMASKESNINSSNLNLIKVKQKSAFGSKI
jgi:hypothetical protein